MRFTRVNFFDGQMLSAGDFIAEQSYGREKRRLHNRMLYGAGVVMGLSVSVDRDGEAVNVSPGFAIDASGNELVVETPARANICGHDTCFVTARYTETLARPVPGPHGNTEFSRIEEGCAIEAMADQPDPELVTLARLVRRQDTWEVDGGYEPVRAVAGIKTPGSAHSLSF